MLAGGVSGVEGDESSPSLDSASESSRLVLSTTTFFGVVSSAWMLVVRRRAKTSDTEKRNMSLAHKCAGYAVQVKGKRLPSERQAVVSVARRHNEEESASVGLLTLLYRE